MRPIVSNINPPTHKLAKQLVKMFSSFKKFLSRLVNNNIDSVKKLADIKIKKQ